MKVPVVDTNGKVLAPTTPRMVKILLRSGKATVLRRFPFTIILKKEVENPSLPDLRLKIDPGSKTTGIALVNQQSGEVVFAAEINHRGSAIKSAMDSRRSLRRGRRTRKTRYRQPRFDNRTRPNRTHSKTFLGFKTGDIVSANIPRGKFAGKHFGRVTIRQRKSFILNGFDVNPDYLYRVHCADGYGYERKTQNARLNARQ